MPYVNHFSTVCKRLQPYSAVLITFT